MTFRSLGFIYLFLPLSILLYYLTPRRGRVGALAAFTLAFYLLADPGWFWLFVVSLAVDYGLSRLMEHFDNRNEYRRLIAVFMVVKNAGLYLGFAVVGELYGTPLPLGVAVYALSSLGYAVDIYSGGAMYLADPLRFVVAVGFFPRLAAGPLTRLEDFDGQLPPAKYDLADIADGLGLFIEGVAKQLLLGGQLLGFYEALSALPFSSQSVAGLWLLPFSLGLSLYFTLSGYCDIARGVALCYGIRLPRNFYYPFQALSIIDFLGRFNGSVTTFYKTYIYHPLGEDSQGGVSSVVNITLVTLLWALWFGPNIHILLFGVYFLILIFLERWLYGRLLARIPKLVARCYTFVLVMLSFTVFAGGTVSQILARYAGMLGLGALPLMNNATLYLISTHYLALAAGALFGTSLLRYAARAIRKRAPAFTQLVSLPLHLALLAVVTALLLQGTLL